MFSDEFYEQLADILIEFDRTENHGESEQTTKEEQDNPAAA